VAAAEPALGVFVVVVVGCLGVLGSRGGVAVRRSTGGGNL